MVLAHVGVGRIGLQRAQVEPFSLRVPRLAPRDIGLRVQGERRVRIEPGSSLGGNAHVDQHITEHRALLRRRVRACDLVRERQRGPARRRTPAHASPRLADGRSPPVGPCAGDRGSVP